MSALKHALIACGVIAATHYFESQKYNVLKEAQDRDRQILIKMMEIIHIRNNLTLELADRIKELEKTGKSNDNIHELINIARHALENHKKESFVKNIKSIDSQLRPNARLPTLKPYDLLDVSTLSYTYNETHILIRTHIPVLTFENTSNSYQFRLKRELTIVTVRSIL